MRNALRDAKEGVSHGNERVRGWLRHEALTKNTPSQPCKPAHSPLAGGELKAILASFLLVLSSVTFSQDTDSIPKQTSQEITYGYDLEDNRDKQPIDTGLSRFHYYDPVDKLDFLYRNTGGLGSGSFRMVCCEELRMGFRMGYDQFNLYRFTKENVPFYRNVQPYTHLNLLIGLRREQTATVTHSQDIGKKFNFGFHYMRFATTGLYTRQRTRHNDIAFTTTFDSKKRYLLQTLFVLNSIRAEENGGVKETDIFEDTTFVSKELVDVELENAENRQREISFHLRHSFGNRRHAEVPVADSTAADSVVRKARVEPAPFKWQLYHELDIGRERYEYTDGNPDSAYYGLFLPDDSIIADIDNRAQRIFAGTKFGFRKNIAQAIIIDVSSSYTLNLIEQDSFTDLQFNYADVAVSIQSDTSSPIAYGAGFAYSFLDYNKNDLKGNAYLGYDFGKAGNIRLSGDYTKTELPLINQRYEHGRQRWLHELEKQSLLRVDLRYRLPKYKLEVAIGYNYLNGIPIWDEDRLPAQYNSGAATMTFELRKLFRFNYFGFDNILYVQLIGRKDVLRFPAYWGVHSFFYERGAFKNKLLTRIGFDIRYNTNYQAQGYFPLTGQFYLQYDQDLTFYPVLDFYICFKVKTARMFFKMQHLNQGMFKDKGYFYAYKYPGMDRTFRFGLSWMFLD